MKTCTAVQLVVSFLALSVPSGAAGAIEEVLQPAAQHLVTFTSGDIAASPQRLSGTVEGGKADLTGTLEASYDFDKWIRNFNNGDIAAFQTLREAQIAAGGTLTGTATIRVDADAVVNSFIEISIPLEGGTYTIKLYTCVDYPQTTVTATDQEIVVTQTKGTSCAYLYPVCSFANEGEDLVYRIRK